MIFDKESDDYFENHQSADYKNLKGLESFIDGVGIMDGGIADNQGIGSMMLIDNRLTRKDKGLDLIMVNDVGSYKMKPWQQDTNEVGKSSTVKNLINMWGRPAVPKIRARPNEIAEIGSDINFPGNRIDSFSL